MIWFITPFKTPTPSERTSSCNILSDDFLIPQTILRQSLYSTKCYDWMLQGFERIISFRVESNSLTFDTNHICCHKCIKYLSINLYKEITKDGETAKIQMICFISSATMLPSLGQIFRISNIRYNRFHDFAANFRQSKKIGVSINDIRHWYIWTNLWLHYYDNAFHDSKIFCYICCDMSAPLYVLLRCFTWRREK